MKGTIDNVPAGLATAAKAAPSSSNVTDPVTPSPYFQQSQEDIIEALQAQVKSLLRHKERNERLMHEVHQRAKQQQNREDNRLGSTETTNPTDTAPVRNPTSIDGSSHMAHESNDTNKTALRSALTEIAKFEGKGGAVKLRAFIHKLDRYFQISRTPVDLQVVLAENKLTGSAESLWFAHVDAGGLETWSELKRLLHLHYSNQFEVLEATQKLKALRQSGSVQEYTTQFNTIASILGPETGDHARLIMYLDNLSDAVRKAIVAVPGNASSLLACQGAALQYDAFTRLSTATTSIKASALTANSDNAGKNQSKAKKTQSQNNKGKDKGPKAPRYPCKFCRANDHFPSDCPKIPAELHELAKRNASNGPSTSKSSTDSPDKGTKALASSARAMRTKVNSRANHQMVMDSGATEHMISDDNAFTNDGIPSTKTVEVADGSSIPVKSTGHVRLTQHHGCDLILQNVLHVPALSSSLFSIPQACDNDVSVTFYKDRAEIRDLHNDTHLATGIRVGNTYLLDAISLSPTALATTRSQHKETRLPPPAPMQESTSAAETRSTVDNFPPELTQPSTKTTEFQLWHRRFGHLGYNNLSKIASIAGFSPPASFEGGIRMQCEPCQLSKAHRLPHPKSTTSVDKILDLVHSDAIGPMPPSTDGHIMAFSFIDDKSRFVWSFTAQNKESTTALACFKHVHLTAERETGNRLKCLRTDRGGEYLGATKDYLDENGIRSQFTIRETPQQNGVAERLNRTIEERTRAILADSGLPIDVWNEVWNTAVYIYNRSPHSALDGGIPLAAYRGIDNNQLDLSNMRIIGCRAYSHILKDDRSKLADVAEILYLVGYSSASKGYRLWNPSTNKVVERYDVRFDETKVYKDINNKLMQLDIPLDQNRDTANDYVVSKIVKHRQTTDGNMEFLVRWKGFSRAHDTWEPTENLSCTRLLRSYFNQRRMPIPHSMALAALTTPPTKPSSWSQAIKDPSWKASMERELASIKENGTFKLVPRPNAPIIKTKWVFKTKLNVDGTVDKLKSRLVARGFTQTHGVDYDETFLPVISHQALRIMVSIAASQGKPVFQIDVHTAFLNGYANRGIYCEQPPGFEDGTNRVWQLLRALYGLKQAGRLWYLTLHEFLIELNYHPLPTEPCVYKNNKGTIIGIYVDDIVGFGDHILDNFKIIRDRFKTTEPRMVDHLLGIRFQQTTEGGYFLDQRHYILTKLAEFGLEDANTVTTPIDGPVLNPNATFDPKDETTERSMIGALLHLSLQTRPDIAFAVNYLARFSTTPTQEVLAKTRRIFRYLSGTIDMGLLYPGKLSTEASPTLSAYVDADWAGDTVTRKSTTGFVVRISNSPVHWKSSLQPCVGKSSTEVEYIAASHASRDVAWLCNLILELTADIQQTISNRQKHIQNDTDIDEKLPPTTLYIDNAGALSLSKQLTSSKSVKHIDVRYHYFQEQVARNRVNPVYVSTDQNTADIFTKALDRVKFEIHRHGLGIQQPPTDIQPATS